MLENIQHAITTLFAWHSWADWHVHCYLITISEWTWNAQHLQQHLTWFSCGRSITICAIVLMLFHCSWQLAIKKMLLWLYLDQWMFTVPRGYWMKC